MEMDNTQKNRQKGKEKQMNQSYEFHDVRLAPPPLPPMFIVIKGGGGLRSLTLSQYIEYVFHDLR